MIRKSSFPLATGDLLADLLKEAGMDSRELAVAVLWRPSPALLKDLQTAYRWAWEYGPCTTRSRDIDPAEEESLLLLACTEWCQHWVRRGPHLICDPIWERKGSDVLDFLRGKIGEERFRALLVEHLSRDDVDWSASATYTPGRWSMYERHKHVLEDYWTELGPEVSVDERLYRNLITEASEILLEEYDRERKAGRRGPGPEDEPPDGNPPVTIH